MKKSLIVLLVLVGALLTNICFAMSGYDVTNRCQVGDGGRIPIYRELYLYGKYPCVGADVASGYYLDTQSCTYNIDGDYAYLEGLVYSTGGGAKPDGSPAHVSPITYKYVTFKQNNKRVIGVTSIVYNNTSINATQAMLSNDNGFARYLFWQIAKYTGLTDSLD